MPPPLSLHGKDREFHPRFDAFPMNIKMNMKIPISKTVKSEIQNPKIPTNQCHTKLDSSLEYTRVILKVWSTKF